MLLAMIWSEAMDDPATGELARRIAAGDEGLRLSFRDVGPNIRISLARKPGGEEMGEPYALQARYAGVDPVTLPRISGAQIDTLRSIQRLAEQRARRAC